MNKVQTFLLFSSHPKIMYVKIPCGATEPGVTLSKKEIKNEINVPKEIEQ